MTEETCVQEALLCCCGGGSYGMMRIRKLKVTWGPSLVVQWPRACFPKAGSRFDSWSGNQILQDSSQRFHTPAMKIEAPMTWCRQWTHNKKKRKKVTWTFETRNVSLVKSVAEMKKWDEGKQMVWMVERQQVLFLTRWVGVCSKPPPYEPSSCELSEMRTCSSVHHVSSHVRPTLPFTGVLCEGVLWACAVLRRVHQQCLYSKPTMSRSKYESGSDVAGTTVLSRYWLPSKIKSVFFIFLVCFYVLFVWKVF